VFIVRESAGDAVLDAASVQNDALAVETAEFQVPVDRVSIAGYAAATGEVVIIDDLYEIPNDRPYGFDASFDRKSGFHSRSMLCFALKNYNGRAIGVVQLINRRDPKSGEIVPFDERQADLIVPFNHVVGSAIERADMLERIEGQNEALRERNRSLWRQRRKIRDLQGETEDAFMLSIELLARAAEIHDEDTGNHIVRTNEYAYFLGQTLDCRKRLCEELHYSAQLHDVGKMSVNSAVLKKEGRLDPGEVEEMNRHTVYGHKILVDNDRLQLAAEIALNHHEKWDGTGYPRGLAGEDIPLTARIVQLGDVYDALRSKRVYKPAFSHEKASTIILKGDDRLDSRGHFDPGLLEIFANHHKEFDAIWQHLAD
jgi:HD-GYP domain-containing protein (c-di-GMP phosphodiesterase class II)